MEQQEIGNYLPFQLRRQFEWHFDLVEAVFVLCNFFPSLVEQFFGPEIDCSFFASLSFTLIWGILLLTVRSSGRESAN